MMGIVCTSIAELQQHLQHERTAGKRIISTNGCFDLLHTGHVRYLQQAKAFGDCLVVALNSDSSVKRFKSDLRPILPEAERAELLTALACVDYVIVFDETNPVDTLLAITADIHTKGADYTAETLPEAPALLKAGIELAFLPLIEGRSTSSIIAKIEALLQQKDATVC